MEKSSFNLKPRTFLGHKFSNAHKSKRNVRRAFYSLQGAGICKNDLELYMAVYVFKGTHTVYLSSSLYIVNQKPMIPRTLFHCIPTWVVRSSG